MSEDRLDLSPLDLATNPARFETLVAAITERAAPELARRARGGVVGVLGHWAWPMLAAASIVAVLSGGALALVHPQAPWVPVAQALQVTEPQPNWLAEGRTADTSDLILALEGEAR